MDNAGNSAQTGNVEDPSTVPSLGGPIAPQQTHGPVPTRMVVDASGEQRVMEGNVGLGYPNAYQPPLVQRMQMPGGEFSSLFHVCLHLWGEKFLSFTV